MGRSNAICMARRTSMLSKGGLDLFRTKLLLDRFDHSYCERSGLVRARLNAWSILCI